MRNTSSLSLSLSPLFTNQISYIFVYKLRYMEIYYAIIFYFLQNVMFTSGYFFLIAFQFFRNVIYRVGN